MGAKVLSRNRFAGKGIRGVPSCGGIDGAAVLPSVLPSTRGLPGGRARNGLALSAVLAGLLASTAFAGAQSLNAIVPDGRTATGLHVDGATTTVTTGTVSGPNAFNSFSHFQVGIGNTVNLVLPQGTANLVNVVRDGPAAIHGILNSYADGEIGGNVYFASPHGFVVGAAGTVNVGSLSVTATDSSFADRLVGPAGSIDQAAVSDLFAGSAPLSPGGAIYIRGRVNAKDGISLRAATVEVGDDAGASSTIAPLTQEETFAATVNTSGVRRGAGLVSRGGKISIVAAGDARLGGRVRTNGKAGRKAGTVEVRAGRDIKVEGSAQVSAKGRGAASDGGDIVVFADRDLRVETGASFNAGGGTSGNGGFIELSAVKTVSLAGGVDILAGATDGRGGRILIDPTWVVIGGEFDPLAPPTDSADRAEVGGSAVPSIRTQGESVEIIASEKISILANAYINTRHTLAGTGGGDERLQASTGDSGDITLKAPEIDVRGAIIAHATDGYAGGIVTLEAVQPESGAPFDLDNLFDFSPYTVSLRGTAVVTGGQIDIAAGEKINIVSGAVLTATRNTDYEEEYDADGNPVASGRSGNITLSAPAIAMAGNVLSRAEAGGGPGATAGDVAVLAAASAGPDFLLVGGSGRVRAASGIEVSGSIRGGSVTIEASTEADSTYENGFTCAEHFAVPGLPGCIGAFTANDLGFFFPELDELDTLGADDFDSAESLVSMETLGTTWQLLSPLVRGGMMAGLVAAQARATVDILSGAVIEADGDVTIGASAAATASTSAFDVRTLDLAPVLPPPLVVGLLRSEASALVRDGARVHAGGALSLSAVNDATLDLHALGSTFDPAVPSNTVEAQKLFRVATIAVSWAEVDSEARIAAGADVAAGSAHVAAVNNNSFMTRAAVYNSSDASSEAVKLGLTLALAARQKSHADAIVEADLSAGAGGVLIEAVSLTSQNVTTTETYVGDPGGPISNIAKKIRTPIAETAIIQAANEKAAESANDPSGLREGEGADEAYNLGRVIKAHTPEKESGGGGSSSGPPVGVGASAALMLFHDHDANARVGSAAPGSETSIDSTEYVAVLAKVLDTGIRNIAISQVTGLNSANVTISAAVSYAQYNHSADARITGGTTVKAPYVAVDAVTRMPLSVTWWTGIEELGDIPSRLNSNFGLADRVMTSYVTATADNDADGVGVAGAVSYFGVNNVARAVVEDGAVVEATAPRIADLVLDGLEYVYDDNDELIEILGFVNFGDVVFQDAISVRAESVAESILLGGNIDFDNLGNSGGKVSVGGTFVLTRYTNDADAAIGAAEITTDDAVTVRALGTDDAVVVAPSAGYGAAFSGAGMLALTLVDSSTHATLSNNATVTAARVAVGADHTLGLFTVAGAIQHAEKVNVGAALAISVVQTDTRALIGDDSGAAGQGRITAGIVDVVAQTGGQVVTLGAAASLTASVPGGGGTPGGGTPGGGTPGGGGGGDDDNKPPTGDIFPMLRQAGATAEDNDEWGIFPDEWSSIIDVIEVGYEIYTKASGYLGQDADGKSKANANAGADKTDGSGAGPDKVAEADTVRGAASGSNPVAGNAAGAGATSSESSGGKFGFGLSGSIAAGVTLLDTRAGIHGARIVRPGDASPEDDAVRVLALRNTFSFNFAGAAALVAAGSGDSTISAAVAGSLALDLAMSETGADITGSEITGYGLVRAEAVNAGTLAVIALDLALNATPGDPRKGLAFAAVGSVSLSENLDRTAARVTGSTVTGPGESGSLLSVVAYDRMYSAVGGGAMKVHISTQPGASVGIAFTYNGRHDPASGATVEALVKDSKVEDFEDVRVAAHAATRTFAAAAMLSRGAMDVAAAGSAVATDYGMTVRAAIEGTDPDEHHVRAMRDVIVRATGDMVPGDDARLLSVKLSLLGEARVCSIDGICPDLVFDPGFRAPGQDDTLASYVGDIAVASGDTVAYGVDAAEHRLEEVLDQILPPGLAVLSVAGTLGNQALGLSAVFSGGHVRMVAEIVGASAEAGRGLTVAAATEATLINLAIAGAYGGMSANGAVTVNMLDSEATARLGSAGGPVTEASGGTVSVTAADESRIWTLAMGLGLSNGSPVASVGVTYAEMQNRIVAEVMNATVAAADALRIEAVAESQIISVATGISAGSQALAGSAGVNIVSNKVLALLGGEGGAVTATAGSLSLRAEDDSDIWSMAGSVGFSRDGGAGGAAVSFNQIDNETRAAIRDAVLTVAGAVSVIADSDAAIRTAAMAGAAAHQWALAGSATVNLISNAVEATLAGVALNEAPDDDPWLPSDLVVTARDASSIWSLAGGVAGGTASVGAGVAFNMIDNRVAASLAGGTARVRTALLDAKSGADIRTIGVGVAIGAAFGGAGAIATNLVSTQVDALIGGGASVDAFGNVGVIAANGDSVSVIAGAAGIGASGAGLGLSLVVNMLDDKVRAAIVGGGTRVDARGLLADFVPDPSAPLVDNPDDPDGPDVPDPSVLMPNPAPYVYLTVATGELTGMPDTSSVHTPAAFAPSLTLETTQMRGLAVVATSTQSVMANAATVGIGQIVGAAVSPVVNIMGGSTVAEIVDAGIGTRLATHAAADHADPDLLVTAASHSYSGNFVIGAAGGMAAAAASAVAVTADRETRAEIRDAEVGSATARERTAYTAHDGPGPEDVTLDADIVRYLDPRLGDVRVRASASQSASSAVAGLSVGLGAATGNLVLTLLDADTTAKVGGGSLMASDLSVTAENRAGSSVLSGAGAGGVVGLAGAVSVLVNESRTHAFIGNDGAGAPATLVQIAYDIDVSATTVLRADAVSAGGALAGLAAAAMANVVVASADTQAGIRNAAVNTVVAPQETQGTTVVPAFDPDGDSDQPLFAFLRFDEDGDPLPVNFLPGSSTTTDYTQGGLLNTPARNVRVAAGEDVEIDLVSGAVAAGLAGFGAGMNLVLFNGTVAATVASTDIDASGAVDVLADSRRVVDALALAGGAGIAAGAGAAVGVVLIGSERGAEALAGMSGSGAGSVGDIDAMSGSGRIGSGNPTLAGGLRDQLNARSSYGVGAAVAAPPGDAISARIVQSAVDAGAVTVSAQAALSASNTASAAGAGLLAGVGGAVAYTSAANSVLAAVDVAAMNAGSVGIRAAMADAGSPAVRSEAIAGGGGALGIGAGVAVAKLSGTVAADAAGAFAGEADFALDASDSASAQAEATGMTVGVLAVGAMVATAERDSDVRALLAPASRLDGFAAVEVTADSAGGASAGALGASGGVLGGSASVATAGDDSTVVARIGAGTAISGLSVGAIVLARAAPRAEAEALGAVVGGAALGTSVARAVVRPQVLAEIGDDVTVSGAGGLALAARQETPADAASAAATAKVGSGGVAIAGSGAFAVAENHGAVRALAGNRLHLPDGNVFISASNVTHQDADASGVTFGGLAAVGLAYSEARSGTAAAPKVTEAVLGRDARGTAGRIGSLEISAAGTDSNVALSTSGVGAAASGSAAEARSYDYASVRSEMKDGADLVVGSLTVFANHVNRFGQAADAGMAGIAGASGADGRHASRTTADTVIGSNIGIISYGDVLIAAEQTVMQTQPSGRSDSARSAAGGVAVGAAADSRADVDARSNVAMGDGNSISAGLHPELAPGSIRLVAGTQAYTSMRSSIETGAGLSGAGAESRQTVNAQNAVVVGAGNTFFSVSNIGFGTYARLSPATNSLVKSWGFAGLVDADARTNVTSAQSVLLSADNLVEALGNVDVTAGNDPSGFFSTTIDVAAIAHSYFTGALSIPFASATGNASSDAAATIGHGTVIRSGQNSVIGAYRGTPSATVEGKGRGEIAGLIPVSGGSSSSSVNNGGSSVTIHGSVEAGAWHRLTIRIDDCRNAGAGSVFCSNVDAIQLEGFEVARRFMADFEVDQYASALQMGESDRQFLLEGMATQPVGAHIFGDMFASGGTITIHADSISGQGSLTARGGPKITIDNYSPNYIALSRMIVPHLPGGEILFTGGASWNSAAAAGLTLREIDKGVEAVINVFNHNTLPVGASDYAAGILMSGEVRNLGGAVNIVNPAGSIGLFSSVFGQVVNMQAPQGVVLQSNPAGPLHLGGNPYSDWNDYMIWPGGDPSKRKPDVIQGVVYLANAVYNSDGNGNVIHSSNNTPFNQRLLNRIGDNSPNNYSIIFFGSCATHYACSEAQVKALSPMNTGFDMGHSIMRQPMVPVVSALSKTASSYSAASIAPATGIIEGQRIRIVAQVIDIKGIVSAGQPADWSVHLDASLAARIESFRQQYRADNTKTSFNLGELNLLGTLGQHHSLIGATYDAVRDEIVLDRVAAGASGARVEIDGRIISTAPLGNIVINAGLGNVQILNDSGVAVRVTDIHAGSASMVSGFVSHVELIDRQKTTDNHWWYVYDADGAFQVYKDTATAATKVGEVQGWLSADLVSSSTDGPAQATYAPQEGLRWQWQLQAGMSRTIRFNDCGSDCDRIGDTNWVWDEVPGSPNNPWRYVRQDGSLTTTPSGRLLANQSTSLPVFVQTISGTIPNTGPTSGAPLGGTNAHLQYGWMNRDGVFRYRIRYHDCGSSECNYGFRPTNRYGRDGFPSASGREDGSRTGVWYYYYINRGTLTMTQSVKADNPIGITFTGRANGTVNIVSNASVLLSGQISNADGQTSISVTGAGNGIEATQNGRITSAGISLGAADGAIGSAALPLNLVLTNNATLTAHGHDGVFVNIAGTARLAGVSAADGDVAIVADQSIVAANDSGDTVLGGNVSLVSRFGAVGTADKPLVVQSQKSLDISANTGIAVVQPLGNIAARQVATVSGDVLLAARDGAILDHAGTTAASVLSEAQVDAIWRHLRLTEAYGSQAGAIETTVAPLEAQVNSAYRQYWNYLALGSEVDGAFVIDADKTSLFEAVYGSGYAAAADERYRSFKQTFADVIGDEWAQLAAFSAEDAGFDYRISAERAAAMIAGATWTTARLTTAIVQSALLSGTGTPVGSTAPTVAGHNLALEGHRGVGTLAAPLSIDVDDLRNGTLTVEQRAALALASTPGDVRLFGMVGGAEVSFSLGDEPAGVVVTRIEVNRTAPLFIEADGRVDARAATGGIYMQAVVGDLLLGAIDAAAGEVSITAPGSIARDGSDPAHRITGGGLRLLAGSGSVGSADAALVADVRDLTAIIAAGDVHLDAVGGDTGVGRVFAGGVADLRSARGGFFASEPGVAVEARDIRLRTTADALLGTEGDIGSAAGPLVVRHADGGSVQGVVAGSAFIRGAGHALHVQSLTAQRAIGLAAENNLAVDTLTAVTGPASLAALGDVELGAVDSGGDFSLSAGGAVSLNGPATVGGTTLIDAASLVMVATASLVGNGSMAIGTVGDAELGTVDSGGDFSLSAGGAVSLNGPATVGGNLLIDAASLVMAATARLGSIGSMTIETVGDAELGAVDSGGDFSLSAGGAVSLNGPATFGGTTLIDAASLAMGATARLTSTGSLTITTVGDAELRAVDSGGDFWLTAGGAVSLAGTTATRGNALIEAASLVMAATASLATAGSMTIEMIDDAALRAVDVGGDFLLLAGGVVSLAGNTTVGANARIEGASLAMNAAARFASAGSTTVNTDDAASFGAVDIRADFSVNAGGAVSLAGNTVIGANARIAGASLAMNTAASFASTGSTTIETIDSAQLRAIDSGGDFSLSAGGAASLAGITSTRGNVFIGAASLVMAPAASLISTGSTTIEASGKVHLGTVDAEGDFLLTAGGAVSLGGATTFGGNALIDAVSLAMAATANLATAGSMTIETIGNAELAAINVGAGLSVIAGGAVSLNGAAITDGNALIEAASLVMTAAASLTSTGSMTIETIGSAELGAVEVGSDFLLSAGGAVGFAGNTTVGANARIAGASLAMNAAASFASIGDTTIETVDAASFGAVDIGADFSIIAGGAVSLNGVATTGGDFSLVADGAVSFAGNTTVGADARIAGASLAMNPAAILTSTGSATIETVGNTELGTVDAGAGFSVIAGGAVGLNGVATTGGDFSLAAGGAVSLAGNTTVGADARIAGASLAMNAAASFASAGSTIIETIDSVQLRAIEAGGDFSLTAGGVVSFAGNTAVGANARVKGASLTMNPAAILTSTGSATIETIGNAELGTVDSGSDFSLTAGGAVSLNGAATFGGNALIDAVSLAMAATASLATAGSMTIETIGNAELVAIYAGAGLSVVAGGAVSLNGAAITDGNALIDAASLAMTATARLASTGSMTLETAGNAELRAIDSGGDFSLTAGGAVGFADNVTVGANARIAGASLAMNPTASFASAGSTIVDTVDAASFGAVDIGAGFAVNAGGAVSFAGNTAVGANARIVGASLVMNAAARFTGAGSTTVEIADAASFGAVDVGADFSVIAGGAVSLNGVATTGGDFSLAAGGAVSLAGNTTVGADARIAGASLAMNAAAGFASAGSTTIETVDAASLGAVDVGTDFSVIAGGTVGLNGVVTTGGDVSLAAGGAVSLAGDTTVGANARIAGASLAMNAAARFASAGVTTIETVGDTELGGIDAGADLSVIAGGAVSLNGVATTGGDFSLAAGGAVSLAGHVGVAGEAALAGRRIVMGEGAALVASGRIAATAVEDAILARLDSAFDGAQAIVVSAATILGNGDGRANAVARGASAGIRLAATSGDIGAAERFLLVDTPHVVPMAPAGSIYIRGLSSFVLADTAAPGGSIHVLSDGDLRFGRTQARDLVSLEALGALHGGSAIGSEVRLVANGGALVADMVDALTATLAAPAELHVETIEVLSSLRLAGNDIRVAVNQKSATPAEATPPLALEVTGWGGSVAASFESNITAPGGFIMISMNVANAAMRSLTAEFSMANAMISESLLIETPLLRAFVNNASPVPSSGMDLQLFQQSGPLFVTISGRSLVTNAFVVGYRPGYQAWVVNYNEPHQAYGPHVVGTGIVRDAIRNLVTGNDAVLFQGDVPPGWLPLFVVLDETSGALNLFVESAGEEVAVNLE